MLTVLIRKDDSTEVPRQVADMAAARELLSQGMPVLILGDDGSKTPVMADDAPVEPPPADPDIEVPQEPQLPSDEPAADAPV